MASVAWFKKIDDNDINLVGRQLIELNDLYKKDFPIPPGFVVTTEAYKEFFSLVEERVMKKLEKFNLKDNVMKIQSIANEIQKLMLTTEMPEKIESEINEAYEGMDIELDYSKIKKANYFLQTKQKAHVTLTTLPLAANPDVVSVGNFVSFLNVQGIEQVKKAIKACWASLFTAKAIVHREKNGFGHKNMASAVVVQRTIQSEKSGMIFTINPENNNTKEIIIQAIRGYSSGIGKITPNEYKVEKIANKILDKDVRVQKVGYFGTEKGRSVRKEVPGFLTRRPVLEDWEIIRLATLAQELEETYETHMQIEFAIEKQKVFIMNVKGIKKMKKKESFLEDEEQTEELEEQEPEEEMTEEEETELFEDEPETEEKQEEISEHEEDELFADEPVQEEDNETKEADTEKDDLLDETESNSGTADEEFETTEEAEKLEEETETYEDMETAFAESDEPEELENYDEKIEELFEKYSSKMRELMDDFKDELLKTKK